MEAAKDSVEIHILAVNDFHGQLTRTVEHEGKVVGSAPYLAAHLLERKTRHPERTLIVHAGDMVSASEATSALLQDEPTIEVLNIIGFDVGIPGNHEFDEGSDEMMRLIYGGYHPKTGNFEGAAFSYIACNIVKKDTLETLLTPSIIREIDGVKIAFIGAVTIQTPITTSPGVVDNLIFLDEAEAINVEVERVKELGATTIIVLAHEGAVENPITHQPSGRIFQIASSTSSDIDVIIGGHTHYVNNYCAHGKLIVQSKCHGEAFGDITLHIDKKTGRVIAKEAEIVPTYHEGMTPHSGVKEIVNTAQNKIDHRVKKEIARCDGGVPVRKDNTDESPFGELIADAERKAMNTDIALVNPLGIRNDIPSGAVTWGDLYGAQPHNNSLIAMQFTGRQLRKILNQQFANSYREQFLQPSGCTFSYDLARPKNDRIVDIVLDKGTLVEDDLSYTVALTHFLARGGDGFSACMEGIQLSEGMLDIDALIPYVKQLPQPFSFSAQGRIRKV